MPRCQFCGTSRVANRPHRGLPICGECALVIWLTGNEPVIRMSDPARKYALTRLRAGDYLCPSNDGRTLWRFSAYEDGSDHGLIGVSYRRRTFWMARRTPMPAGGMVDREEVEYLPWREVGCSLPSRQAAIAEMLGASCPECGGDCEGWLAYLKARVAS